MSKTVFYPKPRTEIDYEPGHINISKDEDSFIYIDVESFPQFFRALFKAYEAAIDLEDEFNAIKRNGETK